jgi:prepilin-type N-terminal cleavage/methylation domain-containing protein
MMRQSGHRRTGFSLIELLVVITIIAVLMGLVLAAVLKVRDVGPRATTTSQMGAIGNAIGTYKGSASFGNAKYIPPGSYNNTASSINVAGITVPPGTWGPFRLRDAYPPANTAALGQPDINSFEAQYIIQVFGVRPTPSTSPSTPGQPCIVTLGNPGLSENLDANQTLTFFLCGIPNVQGTGAVFTGFSSNSQQPFTPRATPTETRRSVNFDPSGGSKQAYQVDTINGFPRLVDGWGTPFAYFAAYNGQTNAYNPLNLTPGSVPYIGGYNPNGIGFTSQYAPSGYTYYPTGLQPYLLNNQYLNPSGYQLISAGVDRMFGLSGNWGAVDAHGQDDKASFSTANLGAGPQ